mgnify:CR=1 FL=1
MTRILSTIHLSDIQKEVLAKVKAAPNSHMAWEVIQNTESSIDDNFAGARDALADLGLLDVQDGTVEITQLGQEQMTKENITDETGELTDSGNDLAGQDRNEIKDPAAQQGDDMGDDMDMGMGGDDMDMGMGEEDPFAESFALLRSLNSEADFLQEQKRLSKKS